MRARKAMPLHVLKKRMASAEQEADTVVANQEAPATAQQLSELPTEGQNVAVQLRLSGYVDEAEVEEAMEEVEDVAATAKVHDATAFEAEQGSVQEVAPTAFEAAQEVAPDQSLLVEDHVRELVEDVREETIEFGKARARTAAMRMVRGGI